MPTLTRTTRTELQRAVDATSANQVAHAAGVADVTVARAVRGENLREGSLMKIANFLQVRERENRTPPAAATREAQVSDEPLARPVPAQPRGNAAHEYLDRARLRSRLEEMRSLAIAQTGCHHPDDVDDEREQIDAWFDAVGLLLG